MKIIDLRKNPSQIIPDDFTGKLVWPSGNVEYYLNGLLHREDGAAVEWLSGRKLYYIKGNLHRIGGSAIECKFTNTYKYYIKGKQITKEAHDLLYNLMKLKGIEL